jgi:hypothetical protein
MVVEQMATPWALRPRANARTRNATGLNVSPSTPVTTALAASSSVIQAGLASRRVAAGVISAAQP